MISFTTKWSITSVEQVRNIGIAEIYAFKQHENCRVPVPSEYGSIAAPYVEIVHTGSTYTYLWILAENLLPTCMDSV
jgi:hypothetical protein